MTWLTHLRGRSRREWAATLLVAAGVLGFVVAVYGVLVVGGTALLGRGSSPEVGLSVLATAVVALAFDRVQSWLEGAASRIVHGGLASPYDVLRGFSGTVAGTYAAEELPARMAKVLTEGTGAEWAQVWLVVGGRPTLAATWPPEAPPEAQRGEVEPRDGAVPGRRVLPVRHGNELLGVLAVQERSQVAMTSVEERLFTGLASQAQLVLRGARLRAELGSRAEQLSARAGELTRSRQRLVDVQDNQRRLLERDIHDGAQQHLVALAVNLRLAQTLAGRSPDRADRLLASQELAAAAAIETLAELSRGIFPTSLAEGGLAAAVEAAATTSPVPVEVTTSGLGRYSPQLELATYFCCLEAMQNVAKHAKASGIAVALRQQGDALVLEVEDDGAGFDPRATQPGSGLTNMRDRVESLDGTLTVDSSPAGTRVRASLPLAAGA
ncbi:MAG TPA: ATP-binding protein [Nocardioidaceae bacterium]|nr:ATP-binding protein [Nocardioidaceae bacterium]